MLLLSKISCIKIRLSWLPCLFHNATGCLQRLDRHNIKHPYIFHSKPSCPLSPQEACPSVMDTFVQQVLTPGQLRQNKISLSQIIFHASFHLWSINIVSHFDQIFCARIYLLNLTWMCLFECVPGYVGQKSPSLAWIVKILETRL